MKNIRFYISFLMFLLLFFTLKAQKENNNWTFADSVGVNFEAGNLFLTNVKAGGGDSNCISDSLGHLLFYTSLMPTNGYYQLFNGFHELIENGDSLKCSTSIEGNKQLILKHPSQNKFYYIITLDYKQVDFVLQEVLYIHLIDIKANEGKGKIIYKNKVLYYNQSRIDSKISACKHSDGKSWWFLIYERYPSSHFVRFLVKEDTIIGPEFQTIGATSSFNSSSFWGGEMFFSTSGTRLAFCSKENFSADFYDGNVLLELYNFDRCTGLLNNPHIIYKRPFNENINFSIHNLAFSPNENYLYYNTLDSLFQFDIANENPYLTKKCLESFQLSENGTLPYWIYNLEKAINGKIYLAYYDQFNTSDSIDNYLGVISEPNKPYPACGYARQGLYLNGHRTVGTLPNMPNYNLQGLPHSVCGPPRFISCGDSVRIGAPRQSCQYYSWAPAVGLSDSATAQPNAAPPFTTTYTLTTYIDGSDQTDTDTVTVFVTPFPNGYITAAPDTFSAGPYTVHFTAAGADTTGLTFTWNFGDQQTGTGAITSHTYDAIQGYLVKLFIQNSSGTCKDTITYNLKLSLITGVNEVQIKQNSFHLYPNPADETVTLEHNYENATVEIFTPLGKVVHSQFAPKPKTTVDLRRLAKGIYYVRLITNLNQILVVKKLIIN